MGRRAGSKTKLRRPHSRVLLIQLFLQKFTKLTSVLEVISDKWSEGKTGPSRVKQEGWVRLETLSKEEYNIERTNDWKDVSIGDLLYKGCKEDRKSESLQ